MPFTDDFPTAIQSTDHIVDAIFGWLPLSRMPILNVLFSLFAGFSFSGEVREPFPAVIQAMEETKLLVTSVDAPSSWNIEEGPPKSGLGSKFHPAALVSLTAPKPLVKFFSGRHFIGGRYVPLSIALLLIRESLKLNQICVARHCQEVRLRRARVSRHRSGRGSRYRWAKAMSR